MSTHWYYECISHDPPLRSEAFTQHTNDEHYWRGIGLALDRPVAVHRHVAYIDPVREHFETSARFFLSQHPRCKLQFINEYGELAKTEREVLKEQTAASKEPDQNKIQRDRSLGRNAFGEWAE